MNVLGVILARGGSKGIPGKNIKPLAGVPLLVYTVLESQRSRRLTKLVLSSEDDEILNLAQKLGCETVKRPHELATDQAASPPCLIHAVDYLEKQKDFKTDVVVLLQPTTPFRENSTIDRCVEILFETAADSVVSVMKAPHYVNPHWVRKIENGYLKPYLSEKDFTRRQELPDVYWRNGQVYVVKKEALFETNDLYGEKSVPYIMEEAFQVNIDSPADFKFAEYLLAENELDFNADFVQKQYNSMVSVRA